MSRRGRAFRSEEENNEEEDDDGLSKEDEKNVSSSLSIKCIFVWS
jgi:hypothetical protein